MAKIEYNPNNVKEQKRILHKYELQPLDRHHLGANVPAQLLGFAPEIVWSPSPAYNHRTDPYRVPETISMGLRDNPKCAARFTPPPFAITVSGAGKSACVGVMAPHGRHTWTSALFTVTRNGVSIKLRFDGNIPPTEAAQGTHIFSLAKQPGQSDMELLAESLRLAYPSACRINHRIPDWWHRPIYCGYGDQVALMLDLEGPGPEQRALAYCIQGLYERWIAILEAAGVPFGTIIIDAGWSMGGRWEPYPLQWPDLSGFISRQHKKGRRVLLWLGVWMREGIPADWCFTSGRRLLTVDPYHPAYRSYVRKQISTILSPAGFNADGFKIDQLQNIPTEDSPREAVQFGRVQQITGPHPPIRGSSPIRGCELLHELQKLIYVAAKNAKSDALITSSTVHPLYADTFDMVRLHDTGYVGQETDVFTAMKARADLAQATLPAALIDTDNWVHTDYTKWLDYTMRSPAIGVPCLFYAERFVRSFLKAQTKPVAVTDLKKIGSAWRKVITKH